jgi:putative hydrolase of the HAD superfamily
MSLNISAITFDFWNTLAVDSQPVKVRQMAAERMATEFDEKGHKIDTAAVLDAFAKAREIAYSYQEDLGKDFTPEQQLEWILEYLDIDRKAVDMHALIKHYTTSLLEIPPTFVPGLKGILESLAVSYRLALICNTGRTPGWVVRRVMDREGVLEYFDTTIFSNEIGLAKPNRLVFEMAAERLGVPPAQILHIGDDRHTDIFGASRAGFKTGWYNPKGLIMDVDCDIVLTSLSEIERSIKEG